MIIDEAHRMKSTMSSTREVVTDMRITWLLLLTGACCTAATWLAAPLPRCLIHACVQGGPLYLLLLQRGGAVWSCQRDCGETVDAYQGLCPNAFPQHPSPRAQPCSSARNQVQPTWLMQAHRCRTTWASCSAC